MSSGRTARGKHRVVDHLPLRNYHRKPINEYTVNSDTHKCNIVKQEAIDEDTEQGVATADHRVKEEIVDDWTKERDVEIGLHLNEIKDEVMKQVKKATSDHTQGRDQGDGTVEHRVKTETVDDWIKERDVDIVLHLDEINDKVMKQMKQATLEHTQATKQEDRTVEQRVKTEKVDDWTKERDVEIVLHLEEIEDEVMKQIKQDTSDYTHSTEQGYGAVQHRVKTEIVDWTRERDVDIGLHLDKIKDEDMKQMKQDTSEMYIGHDVAVDLAVGPVVLPIAEFSSQRTDNGVESGCAQTTSGGGNHEQAEYLCLLTNKRRNNSTLTESTRAQTGEKLYSCDICSQVFSLKQNLKYHILTHSDNKGYCNVCNKTFTSNAYLTIHMRVHTGERPYRCTICSKKFSQYCNLLRHKKIHTGEKPYRCRICKKKFTQSRNLTHHMKKHTGDKPYSCEICGKKFAERGYIKIHTRIHTGERPYCCSICNKNFNQSCRLISHMRIHTGEKPYCCDICKKTFTQKFRLVNHMKIHTGERPYSCDICNKKFTKSYYLKRHIKIHNSDRPYSCNICNKKFTQSYCLRRHTKIHTGERPHCCDICNKKFNRHCRLMSHMKIHTPYCCDICNKKFIGRRHLTNHLKKSHL